MILTSEVNKDLSNIKDPSTTTTTEDDLKLNDIPSDEEIKNVGLKIGTFNNPGPDGYPARFYQHM